MFLFVIWFITNVVAGIFWWEDHLQIAIFSSLLVASIYLVNIILIPMIILDEKDFGWIKRTIKNQLKIYLLIVLATIGLIFLAKPVISIWIGKDFVIDNTLITVMGLFVLVSTWNNIYAYFLNAANKLDIQIKTSIIAIFVNIPLSIMLVKYLDFGVHGIVIGTILSLSLFAIFGPLKTYKTLKGK